MVVNVAGSLIKFRSNDYLVVCYSVAFYKNKKT